MRSKPRRLANEINAGSMADIAFLLLIFFLVATTIVEDQGIMVKLPPWDPNPVAEQLNQDNVFTVKVNLNDQLMVEQLPARVEDLRAQAKYFIMNPDQRSDMPNNPRKAIISFQNDRGTTYETYLRAYNELKAAYHELWEEQSQRIYAKAYEDLTKVEQRQIRSEIPLIISEAEPANAENQL